MFVHIVHIRKSSYSSAAAFCRLPTAGGEKSACFLKKFIFLFQTAYFFFLIPDMKKKIVAFMMAFALAAGSAAGPLGPVIVWAQEKQEQVTEEGFKYEIIEDGISITGYSGDSAELVIPSEIDGKRVTSIGGYVFEWCGKLKDVYYAGNKAQWGKIMISGNNNEVLQSATIHYDSSGPSDGSGGNDDSGSGSVPAQKTAQTITASDLVKTYGVKPFSLGAKSSGNGALSYVSSNTKVVSVASNGTVTLMGCVVAVITVTAAETKEYKGAQKTVKLTVKPKKAALVSVKSKKKKTITVKWKKDAKASGYLIECATDKKFKKNKVSAEVKKNKTVTATVKKLKGGKKYYVRVCAYAKSRNTKVCGDWSKAKAVKVKK